MGKKEMTKGLHDGGAEDLYVRVLKERQSGMLKLAMKRRTKTNQDCCA